MPAIGPIVAYRTPPARPQRLPWDIAATAWAHVATGGVMVLLARPHIHKLERELFGTLLTIWLVTMVVAPVVTGGVILLAQRRFGARLIAAIFVLPLLLAELLLAIYGVLLIAVNAFNSREPHLVTAGIANVAVAMLLVGLTVALIRYISKPCPRANTAILPS